MADPISVASGITALITLSATVLTAGYKYVDAVVSAPDEIKSLVREVAALSAVLPQLLSHFLTEKPEQRLLKKDVLDDCIITLQKIQTLLHECELVSGRGKNLVKTLLWPVKKKEIIKSRERLARVCANLHIAMSIQGVHSLQSLKTGQEFGNKTIKQLAQNAGEAQELKILGWLSSLDHMSKHLTTTALKQPGTDEWFLKEQSILDWLDQGKIFWLRGSSGTGKTVLVSTLINHLINSEAVAYHYCEFSNPLTLDSTQLVGSLVRQLASQMDDVPPIVSEMYHKFNGRPAQLSMLLDLLDKVAQHRTTYIIIDGLDECPNRQTLLDGLQRLDNPRILLSSRPEYDIQQALYSIPAFSIEPRHVELDMEAHVRAELLKMPKLATLPQEELISDLVTRADGMFRWIQCQIDAFKKVKTPRALKNALQALPKGLDETYDRILSSIDEEDHEYVLRTLQWILGSERPLSVKELAEGIALNPSRDRLDPDERLMVPEEIFELCGSLIRIEADTVVLAHFSVKEYLLSDHLAKKNPPLSKFAIQSELSSRHVSMCLLSYVVSIGLRLLRSPQVVVDNKEFPLISVLNIARMARFQDFDTVDSWMKQSLSADDYADPEWFVCLNYIESRALFKFNHRITKDVSEILRCAIMCFCNGHMIKHEGSAKTSKTSIRVRRVAEYISWLQRAWDSPKSADDAFWYYGGESPLCIAAAFDMRHVAQFLIENGALVDGLSSIRYQGRNPLISALLSGSTGVVSTLLELGANINIRSLHNSHSTPLLAAAAHSGDLVKHFLEEYEPDTNLVDASGRTLHYWAIHDTRISQNLWSVSTYLEATRTRDAEFWDLGSLYTTILSLLQETKRLSSGVNDHHSIGWLSSSQLSKYLFRTGIDYYDFAAAFAEQRFTEGDILEHASAYCDVCSGHYTIVGARFVCLDCLDTDLCYDCYANWKQSEVEMEFCKGHRFYEIPRPCWYQFDDGVAMEDGSTLCQVVDFLEQRFTTLLAIAKDEPAVENTSPNNDVAIEALQLVESSRSLSTTAEFAPTEAKVDSQDKPSQIPEQRT